MTKTLKLKDKSNKDNVIYVPTGQIGLVYPIVEKGAYEITMSWGRVFLITDFDDILTIANWLNESDDNGEPAEDPVLKNAEEKLITKNK